MAKLAFLGMGVMGYPMAGHLSKAGHDVTVYNRTFAKAEKEDKQHMHDTAQIKAANSCIAVAEQFTHLRGSSEKYGPCPRCGGDDRFHCTDEWFSCSNDIYNRYAR